MYRKWGLVRCRQVSLPRRLTSAEVESKIRNQQKIIFTRPGGLGSWS